ncbi:hypothetical protein [Streptomyces sp. HM190]|uniref:hypothetical protein n=1 Tax=Streptomyces sp. HM190 TaxID=2695266 RepID=UPI00135A8EC4
MGPPQECAACVPPSSRRGGTAAAQQVPDRPCRPSFHPDDLAALRPADADRVDRVGECPDGAVRVAPDFRVVSHPTARGCRAAYFAGTDVPVRLDRTADLSNTPTSSVVVRLVRLVRRDAADRPAA